MIYSKPTPSIHVLYNEMDRKRLEMEIIYSSGGSWFEIKQDRGKKHLLEHCIASRTKSYDFQALKDLAFRENLSLNAYTGSVSMGLTASGHYSDYRTMLDILLEMAFTPIFDPEILNREKEIVLREISERQGEPSYRLHFEIMKQIFTKESFSNHKVLGDSKMVAQTTLEDFHKLHKQNLDTSNIIICLSGGGMDYNYLETALNSYISQNSALITLDNKMPINFQPANIMKKFDLLPIVSSLAHNHVELTSFFPLKLTFENKPAVQIFENLFLSYGGVLYDRLRDELGLVYSLQSSFDYNMQNLELYLSCELKYVSQILEEINTVFNDFKKHFNLQKFNDFKKLIHKKQDISSDSLGAPTSFTQNMLRIYGVPETQEEYGKRLDKVQISDIEKVYQDIQNNLSKRQVVLVSNDKSIEKLGV